MFQMIKKGYSKVKSALGMGKHEVEMVAGTALVTVTSFARADTGIDTTAVVATITGAVTTVSAIGLAVLSLVVTIKLFKWVQRVL
jgi:Inovirus Coat protein B